MNFFICPKYIFYRTVYFVVSSRMYVIERIFELYGLWITLKWQLIFVLGVSRWLWINYFLLMNNWTVFYMYQPRLGKWIEHVNEFTFMQRICVRFTLFKRAWGWWTISLIHIKEKHEKPSLSRKVRKYKRKKIREKENWSFWKECSLRIRFIYI